jgi:hypothetical protein
VLAPIDAHEAVAFGRMRGHAALDVAALLAGEQFCDQLCEGNVGKISNQYWKSKYQL